MVSTEKTKGMVVGDRLNEDDRQSVQSSLELYKKVSCFICVTLWRKKKLSM